MSEENTEESNESESNTVRVPRLRKALPGERWVWVTFLAVLGSSPLWGTLLGIHFGYVDPSITVSADIVFQPNLSFIGTYLGWIMLGTLGGTVLYAFARVAGVAPLTAAWNVVDTMMDGYNSVQLEADVSDEDE